MPDVSPPKWHLAHTSWFFEQFLFAPHITAYERYDRDFGYLFNSYYESVGEHIERQKRGLISRPTVRQVFDYRSFVDQSLERVAETPETRFVLELGIHHEQQHQELLLTDIKHILWSNPLKPVYNKALAPEVSLAQNSRSAFNNDWIDVEEGLYKIGHDPDRGFSFDNERPRHAVYLTDFELASRLVTNGEYLDFMKSGGYQNPSHWLSQGWECVRQNHWQSPLYWILKDGSWHEMTLTGLQPLNLNAPVAHVSFYEADAYARSVGARLPTEAEWEVAAEHHPIRGSFLESARLHPSDERANAENSFQLWGELWQWTSSSYHPYPGFKPLPDAFSEYNGKFMSNQMILRGGSCATPRSHIRGSYRNFFPPDARWQFSGIRIAR
jgi:ergothioneine biosynthesis protein EgtB